MKYLEFLFPLALLTISFISITFIFGFFYCACNQSNPYKKRVGIVADFFFSVLAIGVAIIFFADYFKSSVVFLGIPLVVWIIWYIFLSSSIFIIAYWIRRIPLKVLMITVMPGFIFILLVGFSFFYFGFQEKESSFHIQEQEIEIEEKKKDERTCFLKPEFFGKEILQYKRKNSN